MCFLGNCDQTLMWRTNPPALVKMTNIKNFSSGSEVKYDPRKFGEILNEVLHSDSPLAVAYRKNKKETKNRNEREETETDLLFKNRYPNTELGIDLKLITGKRGRMPIGKPIGGMITRDGEEHYTFVQNGSDGERNKTTRNPHVYRGKCVNLKRGANGYYYPTFNRPKFSEHHNLQNFCLQAIDELLMLGCLVENEGVNK